MNHVPNAAKTWLSNKADSVLLPRVQAIQSANILRRKRLVSIVQSAPNGELTVRKRERGGKSLWLQDYPACDFVSWNKPVPSNARNVERLSCIEKTTKRDGTVRVIVTMKNADTVFQ